MDALSRHGFGRTVIMPVVLSIAAGLAGCGGSDADSFSLESADVVDGKLTAAQAANAPGFGCTNSNVSPQLSWRNAPEGTKSFVVTVYDPDAPTGAGFWHWTVFDIAPTATSLPTNAGSGSGLPAGAVQGRTDYGSAGYGGPCPPVNDKAHRYVFKIYALNTPSLGLMSSAPAALVSFSAKAAAIASASFTATYQIVDTTKPVPDFAEPPLQTGFTLASNEVAAGQPIGNEQVFNGFGCSGANISPSLTWTGVPAGTQSLALLMYDPDAPTDSGFWHWNVFDIAPSGTGITKGAGSGVATPPPGSRQAVNDYGATGYGGPCPPAGAPVHHYVFTLYALKIPTLGIDATASSAVVGFIARNNAIAKATLTATYAR
jgi:Raf kinase inhibitor-like YbhB/YbcL family protein